jgi:flagellar FliJ protein
MKRFAFNLEKVLELRRHREREAEIELGRAVSRLTEIENRLKAAAAERVKAAGERFRPGNSAAAMSRFELYILRLDNEAEKLAKDAALAELNVEEARAAYIEAARERKVLDNLKEKREQDYRKLLNAEEVKLLDDISGGAAARKGV